ncbi:MAG: zinc ribbon domain-containing protein [Lentisphaerae bacterium]|nr:zinc ribbon domain-containing protein [Lentisphaerota bacterium]
MPTYEYECLKCGHVFEVFQGMTEDPIKRCPKCKGKVKRLIGRGAGVIFKGSGFYETDYRSDSYRDAVKKETSTATSSGSKSDAKPVTTGAEKNVMKSSDKATTKDTRSVATATKEK